MTSATAPISPSTARQPTSGHDLGGPTRPNLDFSDNGWGLFLRLTPGPKEQQEPKAPHTCTYIADNAASPAMKCGCGSRAGVTSAAKDEVAVKEVDGHKFLLPFTPLRLAPVVRKAADDMEGGGLVGEVEKITEKNAEKEKKHAFQAPPIAAP
ncbi:hypothetical protein PMIN07_000822 [Paraphaeosphaeria minitans]